MTVYILRFGEIVRGVYSTRDAAQDGMLALMRYECLTLTNSHQISIDSYELDSNDYI